MYSAAPSNMTEQVLVSHSGLESGFDAMSLSRDEELGHGIEHACSYCGIHNPQCVVKVSCWGALLMIVSALQ